MPSGLRHMAHEHGRRGGTAPDAWRYRRGVPPGTSGRPAILQVTRPTWGREVRGGRGFRRAGITRRSHGRPGSMRIARPTKQSPTHTMRIDRSRGPNAPHTDFSVTTIRRCHGQACIAAVLGRPNGCPAVSDAISRRDWATRRCYYLQWSS